MSRSSGRVCVCMLGSVAIWLGFFLWVCNDDENVVMFRSTSGERLQKSNECVVEIWLGFCELSNCVFDRCGREFLLGRLSGFKRAVNFAQTLLVRACFSSNGFLQIYIASWSCSAEVWRGLWKGRFGFCEHWGLLHLEQSLVVWSEASSTGF